MQFDYEVTKNALQWFGSYLKDRTYKVKVNNTLSESMIFDFGVPQGSILGPILFSLYVKDIYLIASSYNFKVHFYADDAQIYLKCDINTDFTKLVECLKDIQT